MILEVFSNPNDSVIQLSVRHLRERPCRRVAGVREESSCCGHGGWCHPSRQVPRRAVSHGGITQVCGRHQPGWEGSSNGEMETTQCARAAAGFVLSPARQQSGLGVGIHQASLHKNRAAPGGRIPHKPSSH